MKKHLCGFAGILVAVFVLRHAGALPDVAGARAAQPPADPAAIDSDGDGVPDARDCAPYDPRLSSIHTYYWDLDGDQFGDPGNTVSGCTLTPPLGSVLWGNDPNDFDNRAVPTRVPKGPRTLGLDFADAASTGEWRSDLARELGAEA